LNLPVRTIIDVGAAAGSWSLMAEQFWPECTFVLFEPLEERKEQLQALTREKSNFLFVPCAAGSDESPINFHIAEDLDGSGFASGSVSNSEIRKVAVRRIDHEIKTLGLVGPYVVKLDTHGYEVPILEGCAGILHDVELFIIECYGFRIVEGSLLFWEMCREMERLGFSLFDLVDVMHRPKDGAFWQCDAFFLRKGNSLFNDNRYS
jgi:FkbM family methyltransferase